MAIGLFKEPIQVPDGQWLLTILVLFAVWLCIFLLKYAAGYALWYSPYTSRRRAITLSVIAILSVYLGLLGCGVLFYLFQGQRTTIRSIVSGFYEFSKAIYCIPYIAAALVGWRFAKIAPDIRQNF